MSIDGIWKNSKYMRRITFIRAMVMRAEAYMVNSFLQDKIKKEARVLEVGSGTGHLFSLLDKEYRKNWIQFDASKKFMLKAKEKFPDARYAIGDALKLPFKDDCFDVVTSFSFLDSVIWSLDSTLAEIRRVLRPGGIFVHFKDDGPAIDYLMAWVRSHEKSYIRNEEDFSCYGALFIYINGKNINVRDYWFKLLRSKLNTAFRRVETRTLTEKFVAPKTETHRELKANYFHLDRGDLHYNTQYLYGLRSLFSPNNICEKVTMQVSVAKK
ncbi:MAG: class I SAM-dependent methyltransferase [Candidatus Saganbacteria bacterium]|nr:class I SAM-dependent methyltransferase [Candidatus Saganbacteria bacterium]